jgi:hypothetical protein
MFSPNGEVSLNLVALIEHQTETDFVDTRVARWFVFKPKIPIWVNVGVP